VAIHLTTLGALRCTFNGSPTDIPRQRVRCALLVLLASERQISRARIGAMLWPESDRKSARHVLSQTLYELRRSFGDDWLTIDGEIISATDRLTIDTDSFENVARAGAYKLALRLCGGPFLDGFVIRSAPWTEWVEQRRGRLDALRRQIAAEVAKTLPKRPSRFDARSRRVEPPRPRLRAAIAAAVAFITLVLHAATPGLTPAAISVPDGSRHAVFAFDSDVTQLEVDEQDRVARAIADLGGSAIILNAGDFAARSDDLVAKHRAARAVAAGRVITGRITRRGASVIITADASQSYGGGQPIGRASVVLHPGADADSAFAVLVRELLAGSSR
jgi:hypothetical protein